MKIFSKISASVQDKFYSLFPGLVAHPLQAGFTASDLGFKGVGRAKGASAPAAGNPVPSPRASALPQASRTFPSVMPLELSNLKPGAIASILTSYAAEVAANDQLRGQLAAVGRKKPATARMTGVSAGSIRLPQGVTIQQALAERNALRSENDEFTKELRALVPTPTQPAQATPKLTEAERIFATWEFMTGDIKSLYYRAHEAVLRGPRPSSLGSLSEAELESEILFQVQSEGLPPEETASPSAGPSGPALSNSEEAIWQQFNSLSGAQKTAYYRAHKAVLSKRRAGLQAQAAVPANRQLVTAAQSPEIADRLAIFDRFESLSGAPKAAFYRQHAHVLAHPRSSLGGSSGGAPRRTDAVWNDPAPELFARWESLTGAAKTEFYRQHQAVLSSPRDFYAVKA